jgi:hypothetical protein
MTNQTEVPVEIQRLLDEAAAIRALLETAAEEDLKKKSPESAPAPAKPAVSKNKSKNKDAK